MGHGFSITDWDRIFFGDAPAAYLLELVVRVLIIYIVLMIAIRFMGKKMSADFDRLDLAARVALAAAVGLPMKHPEHGLLVSAMLVVVILVVGRLLAIAVFKSTWFERLYEGRYALLVKDGQADWQQVKKSNLTRENVFAALRSEGIRQLGEVSRLYIEANGEFSIVRAEQPVAGEIIVPHWDIEMHERIASEMKQLQKSKAL